MKDKKIAIIGAGPMGLAVAYQLIKDGFKPVVYEADDRVGGMSASFDFDGLDIERYYHFHCTSDEDFFQILDELKMQNKLHWVSTKMGYWTNGMLQPWGNPIALLTFKGLGFISKFRYGLHAFMSTKRDDWEPLEKYDAITWIKKWIGDAAFTKLWKKLFDLKFYHYSNNLSAPWIWSRIRRIGRSRYSIFKEKLGYLDGGSATLMNSMRDFIEENGGKIKLNSTVEKIIIDKEKVQGIRSKGKDEIFDMVISTIPLPIIAKIAKDLPKDAYDKYCSKINIGCVCVIAKIKRQLSENFWLNINDDTMDIPGIIEYGNLNPNVGHIIYMPYYMPQKDEKFNDPVDIYKEKFIKYIKTINPDITDSDVISIKINKYYFSQPICEPNFLKNLPDVKSGIKGLWIADTSHYYPEDRGISESIGFGRKLSKRIIDDI